MKKNNEYSYIQPQVDSRRKKKKRKKKKKGGFAKIILVLLALLVIALAAALLCVKYVFTDFYFSELLPDKPVAQLVDEKIIGRTTTTTTTSPAQTTTEPVSLSDSAYLDHSDFELEAGKKGAFVGNILNGGKVDRDNGIIYHIVDGKGIYKFEPNNESFSCVYKSSDVLSSFNIRGDYFYFVNESDNALYKVTKSGKNLSKVADGISLAYIYDSTAYCISADNSIVTVNTQDFSRNVLYSAYGNTLGFIGISKDRVFFTDTDPLGNTSYYCVLSSGGDAEKFRLDTVNDSISSMSMENGFMYYFEKQADGRYNLIRQKYGSQKVVTLVQDVGICAPVIVEQNRVFYADLDEDKLKLYEINMNTDKKKMMLYSGNITASDNVFIQHGGEYDFIIGQRQNGDKVYRASSNLTGSSNVMTFGGGKWSY